MHYSDKKIKKGYVAEIKDPLKLNEEDVNAANDKLNQLKQNLETSNKLKAAEAQKQKEADAKAKQKRENA